MSPRGVERLSPERLAEIRYRCEHYHSAGWEDMHAVLAELDALRSELEQERRKVTVADGAPPFGWEDR